MADRDMNDRVRTFENPNWREHTLRMILFRELQVTALVIIITLAMVVFSLGVLGIYYVHS